MCPPLVGVEEEERQSNVMLVSSPSANSAYDLRERNYMGLTECSSVGSCALSPSSVDVNLRLNLRSTELTLGLPGSGSPETNTELNLMTSPTLDEKPLFPMFTPKSAVSRTKRGFSDTVDLFAEGTLRSNLEPTSCHESPSVANDTKPNHSNAANNRNTAPAPKSQVVGWPPVRSSFKRTLAASVPKAAAGVGALFMKVSMDGAPYLRKVDLRAYSVYQELASALEKMFGCSIGQYGSHDAPGTEKLSDMKLKDLLNGSEYVVTYVDKDGDSMLVGDVDWEYFINNCKRLRIMKSCDAIGLGCGTKL